MMTQPRIREHADVGLIDFGGLGQLDYNANLTGETFYVHNGWGILPDGHVQLRFSDLPDIIAALQLLQDRRAAASP